MPFTQTAVVVNMGQKRDGSPKVAVTMSFNFLGENTSQVNMNGIIRNAASFSFNLQSVQNNNNYGRLKSINYSMLFLESDAPTASPAGDLFIYCPTTRMFVTIPAPVVTNTASDYSQASQSGVLSIETLSPSILLFAKATDAEGANTSGQLSLTLFNYRVSNFNIKS